MLHHDPNAGPNGRPGEPKLAPNKNHGLRVAVRANYAAQMIVFDFGPERISFFALPIDKVEALIEAIAAAAAALECAAELRKEQR
jgi:hypothetical protein